MCEELLLFSSLLILAKLGMVVLQHPIFLLESSDQFAQFCRLKWFYEVLDLLEMLKHTSSLSE
jgi:hypothetical protein